MGAMSVISVTLLQNNGVSLALSKDEVCDAHLEGYTVKTLRVPILPASRFSFVSIDLLQDLPTFSSYRRDMLNRQRNNTN